MLDVILFLSYNPVNFHTVSVSVFLYNVVLYWFTIGICIVTGMFPYVWFQSLSGFMLLFVYIYANLYVSIYVS